MAKVRIVFMGTPDFAVASLDKIYKSDYEIAAVITSPDKQSGRGLKINESAVKKYAKLHKIKILQPEKLKDELFLNQLKNLNANLFIVVAFRMLPELVWKMPKLGTINLHASLLPQYRGAAPINWAIMNGEKKTGITTFFIEKEIDTGNIIAQRKVEIITTDTAGSLHDKLMIEGSELLLETIKRVEKNEIRPIKQGGINIDGVPLKLAPKIFKPACKIDFNKPVKEIYNFIRGLCPYPTAWTKISKGEKSYSLKIFSAEIEYSAQKLRPFQIFTDNNSYFKISCKDGFINILDLQLEGKKRIFVKDFLRGFKLKNCLIS